MEYLETAVSETVAVPVQMLASLFLFHPVYPDIHFSISFTALVNKGREETD